jgi:hypothetical protein
VAVVADDYVSLSRRNLLGNATWRAQWAVFRAATSCTIAVAGISSGLPFSSSSTSRSFGVIGHQAVYTDNNTLSETEFPDGGTARAPFIHVATNANSDTTVIELYADGVATGFKLDVPAGYTGMFAPSVSPYTVADGAKLRWRVTKGAGGSTFSWTFIGFTLEHASNKSLLAVRFGAGANRTGTATVHYVPLINRGLFTTTVEADVVMKLGFAGRLSLLKVLTAAPAYDCVITLRKNGVDTALTVTRANGAAQGWTEDASNTVDFGPEDELSLSVVGGTSGNCQFHCIQMTLEDLSNDAAATITLGDMTGAGTITADQGVVLAQTLGSMLLTSTATNAISAALAQTLGSISLGSAIIAAPLTATLAKTLGAVTLSAQATLGQNVALAKTLGAATLASAMGAPLNVVLAQTLGSIALAGVATAGDRVTLAKTLGAATLAAQATVDQGLTLVRTLGAVTLAAQASTPVGAVLSAVLAPMVLSGAVSSPLAASLAKTLGAMTLLGSAQAPLSATLVKTLGGLLLGATVRLERTYRRRYLSWLVY